MAKKLKTSKKKTKNPKNTKKIEKKTKTTLKVKAKTNVIKKKKKVKAKKTVKKTKTTSKKAKAKTNVIKKKKEANKTVKKTIKSHLNKVKEKYNSENENNIKSNIKKSEVIKKSNSSFISIPDMPVYKGKYILYASGNLNITSIKNNEFFVLFYADVRTKKRKSFDVKLNGIIKIIVPTYEVSAENQLFEWIEKKHKDDRILEDREKKWTKKIIQSISLFSSTDNKFIKKIEINWKYIEKNEKLTKIQIKILKALFKIGWTEYDGNLINIDIIKTNKFKPNLRVIKKAISKNPLPLLIPTYRFIDDNENLMVESPKILEIIPRK